VCRQKGVDLFVEAALRLCPGLPDAHFVVVGDAEDANLLRAVRGRIEGAGLTDRITFAGHSNDIADIYAALDLLVLPSRWEGFGLVAAEAMAAGVPVIATDVGGLPTVVGDAGRLIPPEDADALSSAIENILNDKGARARMISAGKSRAARFDWSVSADLLASIYEGLCPCVST
jgi:mannosyltransferase